MLDVDSTLIEHEVIDELADVAGVGAEVAAVTVAAMHGDLDFRTSLERRVGLLSGLSVAALAGVRSAIRLTPGARELVEGVHALGGRIAAVSGGFHEVLDPLAAELGLDAWRANGLEAAHGRLTGRLRGPIVDAAAKSDALRMWAAEAGVPAHRTVAVGDGANDLAMIATAGLSIAFMAKPPVRDAAHVVLDERDLSLILGCLA